MPHERQIALGVFCATLAASLPSAAAERGHVSYVTRDSAYLDVGSADGLVMGDLLVLQKGGKTTDTCRVLTVAEHTARCSVSANVRRHASFVLPRPGPRPAVGRAHPGPLPAGTVRRFTAAIAGNPYKMIDYRAHGRRGLGAPLRMAWVSLSHDNWASLGGPQRDLQMERLDVGVAGARLGPSSPWQASARATGLVWTSEDALVRFRRTNRAQLYVWQAQLDNARQLDGAMFAAGRILPAWTPGVSVLDGAQLGWRLGGRDVETGIYGGFLPSPMSLAPSRERYTAGLYNRATRRLGSVAVLQNSARLAFVSLPSSQDRFELETLTGLSIGSGLQVGFSPRLALVAHTGRVVLEAARLDVNAALSSMLRLSAGGRYETGDVDIVNGLVDYVTLLRTTAASQAMLAFTPYRWISIALENAIAWDKGTGTLHVLSGPELGFPRLFGDVGGASATYLFETGTKPARSAFAQCFLRLGAGTSLTLRGSYFEDLFQTDNLLREMSFYAGYSARLLDWLDLDLSALTRHGLHNARIVADAPYSLTTSVRLTGRL